MFKKLIRQIQYTGNYLIGHTLSDKQIKESFGDIPIDIYDFLLKLNNYNMENFQYKSDGKLDFSMHPRYFAWRKAGDCDDWSYFCKYMINMLKPEFKTEIVNVYNEKEGHSICIIFANGLYHHIGNWGLFLGFQNYPLIANHIFPDWNRYEILNYNLNVLEIHKRKEII
jgi:hypothetical protein